MTPSAPTRHVELRWTLPARKLRTRCEPLYSGPMATPQETYARLEREALLGTALRCHQAPTAERFPRSASRDLDGT
jgi:hypothetical protein